MSPPTQVALPKFDGWSLAVPSILQIALWTTLLERNNLFFRAMGYERVRVAYNSQTAYHVAWLQRLLYED
jgi:hypothetical protein